MIKIIATLFSGMNLTFTADDIAEAVKILQYCLEQDEVISGNIIVVK